MKKIFLIPLLTLCTCVMAWGANVARIGDTNYTSFNTAFAAATEGQTIVLLANIEKAGKAANELRTVSCNITIDGQGQYSVSRAFQVSANKTLTLKDVTVNTTTKPSPAGAIILNNGATLVMNNAKIAPATAAILPVRTVQGASGTIQLVGTTNEIRNNGGSTFYVYNQTAEDNTSTLTITGEGKLNAYHTGSAGNLLGAQANKGQYQINADVTFHAGNTSTLIGANAILPDDLLIVAFSGENAGQYKLIANTDEAKTANGVVAVFGKIAYTSIENPVARITFSDNRAAIDCPDASALHEAVASLPTDGTVATVSLLNDIDGGVIAAGHSLLSFPAETKSILDLNGHILSAQLNLTNYDQRLTIHVINNFGELTINDSGSNGTIKNSFDALTSSYNCMSVVRNNAAANMTLNKCIINNGAMGVDNYGKLTINEDVRIEVAEGSSSTLVGNKYGYTNGGCALDVRNGSITIINGGFIKSHAFNAVFSSASAILAINGGDFYGVDGFGWLHDGMTYKTQLVISGGSFDLDPYDYVDQYHYAALDNDRYVINELAESDIYTVYTFNELKESLNLATQEQGVYVTLGADITVPEMVTLKHGSRLIIPAGRTLTVLDGGLFVNEGRTLCEGTIATIDNGFFSKPASVEGNGTLSISNLSISIDGDVVTYQVSNGMQLQYLSYLASLVDYEDKTWNISLTTDINLPEEANFEQISYIHGTIEGNNHAINNLTMNSKSDYCSLINYFEGTFQNVTLNNVNIATGGLASGLFIQILPNSEVKNVTVNGSITSSLLYATGFVSSEYQQDFSGKHLRFVNCVNNATITSAKSFAGGFFGTISSSAGTIGFYNCANNGAISGAYAGAFGAYGCGADLDVIAFTNTGTITGSQNGAKWKVGDVNYVGYDNKNHNTTYLDATQYTAVFDGEKYIAKQAGVLDNKTDGEGADALTTDWALSTTWTDNEYDPVVPNESDVVTVNNTNGVVVSNNTFAVAKEVTVTTTLDVKDGGTLTIGEGGLQIAAGATVTVEEGATLVVGKDGINIADGGHLVVEATEDGGTGVVLVDPAATENTRPEATVELVPDAYKISEDVYKYRYIGIPLYFEASESFDGETNWTKDFVDPDDTGLKTTYLKQWKNGAWAELENGLVDLVPFKGYAISNKSNSGIKYTFKGKLVGNGDGQMNFVPGFNLFANSYTAPINIQTLLNGLSDDVKATIYMFDNDRLRSVSKADFAGFRTPKFTVIPSLQAFFVLMDDGTSATETVNYAEAVFNNSLGNRGLYAPQRQETPEFNRVRINIAAENGANDEVYLIEAADYTNDFENGFDEAKFMNNGLNIFATTAYGRQATQISNELNGTFIGVQGNGTYTLTFDELVGEEYQIRDLENDAVIAMSENNTYTFSVNGTNEARFIVETIAKMPTAIDNVADANIFVSNNTLFVGANNADIQIFAANGQLVLAEKAQATVDLSGLNAGVYTVRVANQTLKFVK